MMLDKYRIILACAGFIINKDKKVLIVKKSPQEHIDAGLWTVPGGKINPNEPIEEGLIREIREEVGIEVELVDWIGEDVFQSFGYFFHAQHFLCKAKTENIKLEKKLLQYRFIKKGEIHKYHFPENIKKRLLSVTS